MFCNQNAYTPKSLDPRSVLQKIHSKTGTATRKLISKQDFLQPYFDCEFSDVHSSRIAQNIERYIKITKKYQRETKFFVEAVLNKIYLLHKYNLKVAEVTFKYPLTPNFTQLLMRYVVLECSVLYKREHHTPRYEILVEERILKLLQTLYNSYLESLNSVPPEKLFKERCVAILNLFIKIKFEFEIQNDLMENIAKKLLIKMGRLEQVNALKKRCIPCPLDTFLSDPAVLNTYKNIITSDYGTDDNLKIEEEIIQVDTQNEDNDSNQELDIKQDISEILRVSNRIQENAETSSNQIKKVPTIYIDDDNEEMIVLEEEIETSSRSTRRQKAEEEKKLVLREKQYEMFSNHKPFDDVKPYVKNEVIDLNSDEESSTLENNSNSNNNRVNNINTVRGSLLVDEIVILDDDADSISVQPYIMSDSLKAVKESNEVDILELSSDEEEQFNVIPKEEEEELLRDETEDHLNRSLKSVEDSKIISNTAINNVKTAQSNTSNVNTVEIQEDISQAAIEKFNISVKNAFGPLNVSLPLTDTLLSSIEDTLDTQLENIDKENKTWEDNVTEERQLSNDSNEETQHEIILKHDTLRDNETNEKVNEDTEKKSTYGELQIIDKCKETDDVLEKNSIENSSFEVELIKNETQNETSENNIRTKITDLNVNFIEMGYTKILNGENIKQQDMSYSEKGTSSDMQTIAEYTNHTDMSERNQSTKERDKGIEDSSVSNPLLDIAIQKPEGLSLEEQPNEDSKEKTLVSENLIVPVTCSIDICRDPLIEEKCLTLTFKENALTRSEVIEENHNSLKLLKQNEINVNILMEETEANDSDNTITEVSEVEGDLLKNDDVLISSRPLEVIKDSEIISTSSECKSKVEENITYQPDENEGIVEEPPETTPQIISGHMYELSETDLCQNEDVGTNNFEKDVINVPNETVVTNEETTHKLRPNNIEKITEDQDSLETSASSYKIEESLKDDKSIDTNEKLQENNIDRTGDATKDDSSVSSTDELKDHIVMNSNNLNVLIVSNEERTNLYNKDNNLNENDGLEIPSDIELNQKKSLDESSVKQFPDQIKNLEQLNTDNTTIFNKIQTETIERQDDGDKIVKDINELEESENDNDACKNQIEGAHSTQTSETKEQPVSEQVLEETVEKSAEMDVSQLNTECIDKNMTENENTIENCESIHSVSENDTSEKDHKKQCEENKIIEESTNIKDNSTSNLFESSSKELDKAEQIIEEPNENFLGKKIYKNEQDTTTNSHTEKLAEETFSPLNLQTNENNEMEELFQFQSTEHEIEVATEDIEHFELIQQEVNKNDTTVTEQQYLNQKTIDKEENIINKLETSEVELFQENKFEGSMCHETGENHFETIDNHKNVIAATEEQHVKENMTEEENGIHKLETEVCSENTYEDNLCHKTENHLEIVKSTKNYSTGEENVNEKITVEETNIIDKSEIEVCYENTYEDNIYHITENNFEIIKSTNYSKATEDNANEKIIVEKNCIIDKLETSEVEMLPENTHEGNICHEIDQNDFETADSNKNDTTATEEQHVNEKLMEEEENGIIHKLKTSEIKVFTENTYEDNMCHKTDVNNFETETSTDSEIVEEICYEKYNESNLIDDLNIQKEEIIVEDTLELGASEEIIMNEDHSESCTREATDETTPNNNEQSRREKIIPSAIKIEQPLMKKEEIEINTRITNNQILPKVGQHLEICDIPDENTSLDILATVASEMSRQDLLKTRKEKKKKKVSHERRKKQFDLKTKIKGAQKRQNNSNIKLNEALDVSTDVENKRVTRSARKERKPEFYQEPKCKPHDFVITNNSGAPPPSNNIYTQKLSDVPLTSEDSNDSEGNLLIDEDIDVKSIKLNPLQNSKKLACYDEDTMEENINFCCEPKVRGTVLISIPDIYQGNFEFLTQIEQLDNYPNHSFGKEDIDIQNNRNLTADKIYLGDSLKSIKNIPDAKPLINTEIGNSQKTEYLISKKKNHKPFRTKAEQKDYDKFSLKPYVSIERLNITSKNEKKQKYIRSESIDMSVIRNIGDEQTSNNMDNTIVENRVLKNKPAISTEVENLKSIKDEILKQEIKNLPCVKRHEDSDDDIPLSQRNQLEIKQMKKSLVSSKCIHESKKEKSSNKTNYEKTVKEKNSDKPKLKSRKKHIDMKEYKDDGINLTKKLVNEEKSTMPNNICSSSASSITQTSIDSTASCLSMEKDICSTSLENSTVKNDESESIPQSNFQVQCGGRSYEEFMKSSNTKYYTTPKLRRKSVSRHNLNRNEKNSDIKFEETKQIIFNTDKKYYTPPKLRRKSMIESDIKSENTPDAKRTTPKQIKLSTSKVDILSKCKNTISPTTEKLKKKLEIDFKLNCTTQESSDNSLQKLPEISEDSDKMPNPEKVNPDTKSVSINSTTAGDQLSSNVNSNSSILDVNKQNTCEELLTVEANITNPTKSELNINISLDPNTLLNEKESNVPHEVGKITSADSSLTRPTKVHQTKCGEEEKLSSSPECRKTNAITAKPKMQNNSETFKNQQTIPKENMEIKSDSGTNSSKDELIENEDENLDDLPLAKRTTISNQDELNNPNFKNEIKSHKKSSKKIVSNIGTENRQQNKFCTHTGNIKIKHKNVLTSKSKAKQTKKIRKNILNEAKIVKRGSRTGKINRKLNILRKSKMLNNSKHRGKLSKKHYKNKIELYKKRIRKAETGSSVEVLKKIYDKTETLKQNLNMNENIPPQPTTSVEIYKMPIDEFKNKKQSVLYLNQNSLSKRDSDSVVQLEEGTSMENILIKNVKEKEPTVNEKVEIYPQIDIKPALEKSVSVSEQHASNKENTIDKLCTKTELLSKNVIKVESPGKQLTKLPASHASEDTADHLGVCKNSNNPKRISSKLYLNSVLPKNKNKNDYPKTWKKKHSKSPSKKSFVPILKPIKTKNSNKTNRVKTALTEKKIDVVLENRDIFTSPVKTTNTSCTQKNTDKKLIEKTDKNGKKKIFNKITKSTKTFKTMEDTKEEKYSKMLIKDKANKSKKSEISQINKCSEDLTAVDDLNDNLTGVSLVVINEEIVDSCKTGDIKKSNIELNLKKLVKKTEEKTSDMDILVSEDIKTTIVNKYIPLTNDQLDSKSQTDVPVEDPWDVKHSSHTNEEISMINESVDTKMNHKLGTDSKVDMPIEKPMDIRHSSYSNEEILIVNEKITIKSSNVNETIASVNHELHSEPKTDVPVEYPVDVKDSSHVNEEFSVTNEEVDAKMNHELGTESEVDMPIEKLMDIKHSSYSNEEILIVNEVIIKSSNVNENISSVNHELHSEPQTDVPVENPVDVKDSSHVNEEISVINEEVDTKMNHELDTKSEIVMPVEKPLDIEHSSHVKKEISVINEEVDTKSSNICGNISSVYHELDSEPEPDVPVENPVDVQHSSHVNKEISVINEEVDTKMIHELDTKSEIDMPIENPRDIKHSSHTNDEILTVNEEVTIKSSSVNENISLVNNELHSEPQTDVPVQNPVDIKHSSHINEEILVINEEMDAKMNHELGTNSELDTPVEMPLDIKHSFHTNEEILIVNEKMTTKSFNINENISSVDHELNSEPQMDEPVENPVDVKHSSHFNEEISMINEVDTEMNDELDTKSEIYMPVEKPQDIKHSSHANKEEEEITIVNEVVIKSPNIHDNISTMNHEIDNKSQTNVSAENPVDIKQSSHCNEKISVINEEVDTKSSDVNDGFLMNHKLDIKSHTDMPVPNPVHIKHSFHATEEISIIMEESDTKLDTPVKSIEISLENIPSTINEKVLSSNQDAENKSQLDNVYKCDNTLQENSTEYEPTNYTVTIPLEKVSEIENILVEEVKESVDFSSSNIFKASLSEENNIVALDVENEHKKVQMLSEQSMICINEVINHNLEESKSMLLNNDPKQSNHKIKCKIDSSVNQLDNSRKDDALDENLHLETKQQMEKIIDEDDLDTISAMSNNVEETLVQSIESQEDCVETEHISQVTKEIFEKDSMSPLIETKKVEESTSAKITKTENKLLVSTEIVEHGKLQNEKQLIVIKQDSMEDNSTCLGFNKTCENTVANIKLANAEATTNDYLPAKAENQSDLTIRDTLNTKSNVCVQKRKRINNALFEKVCTGKKSKLLEIKIDVSTSGIQDAINTSTKLHSPLSTSPRKKDKKSIECIINQLKEEKEGSVEANEELIKSPLSSPVKVDVATLKNKLLQKIKSQNSLKNVHKIEASDKVIFKDQVTQPEQYALNTEFIQTGMSLNDSEPMELKDESNIIRNVDVNCTTNILYLPTSEIKCNTAEKVSSKILPSTEAIQNVQESEMNEIENPSNQLQESKKSEIVEIENDNVILTNAVTSPLSSELLNTSVKDITINAETSLLNMKEQNKEMEIIRNDDNDINKTISITDDESRKSRTSSCDTDKTSTENIANQMLNKNKASDTGDLSPLIKPEKISQLLPINGIISESLPLNIIEEETKCTEKSVAKPIPSDSLSITPEEDTSKNFEDSFSQSKKFSSKKSIGESVNSCVEDFDSTNVETNLLNLCDLMLHVDSVGNVTRRIEESVTSEAVCMLSDIISTTISSTANKLPCVSSPATIKFTFPVTSQANIKDQFVPMNEVDTKKSIFDDNSISTDKLSRNKNGNCLFSLNEQINSTTSGALASSSISLNLQEVDFSKIPIDSTQPFDLISPNSMMQTSAGNDFINEIPVDNEVSDITEIRNSNTIDHNYTMEPLGGPLLSGRPEEEHIFSSAFNKILVDSPGEFPLNDNQLPSELSESDDTYKLNLDNEYAVKNLVMLGGQTSDVKSFPLSNYNLSDIERMNLIEDSISSSEENSNSLDTASLVTSMEQESRDIPSNAWAQFIVDESSNQAVTVSSCGPRLTSPFSISQNDLIEPTISTTPCFEEDALLKKSVSEMKTSNKLNTSSLEQLKDNDPWAQFIANENLNQKVVVLPNEQFLTSFPISRNSFTQSTTLMTSCVDNEIILDETPELNIEKKQIKLDVPKDTKKSTDADKKNELTEMETAKCNIKKNKKPKQSSQKDIIRNNDFLPKRTYSRTVLRAPLKKSTSKSTDNRKTFSQNKTIQNKPPEVILEDKPSGTILFTEKSLPDVASIITTEVFQTDLNQNSKDLPASLPSKRSKLDLSQNLSETSSTSADVNQKLATVKESKQPVTETKNCEIEHSNSTILKTKETTSNTAKSVVDIADKKPDHLVSNTELIKSRKDSVKPLIDVPNEKPAQLLIEVLDKKSNVHCNIAELVKSRKRAVTNKYSNNYSSPSPAKELRSDIAKSKKIEKPLSCALKTAVPVELVQQERKSCHRVQKSPTNYILEKPTKSYTPQHELDTQIKSAVKEYHLGLDNSVSTDIKSNKPNAVTPEPCQSVGKSNHSIESILNKEPKLSSSCVSGNSVKDYKPSKIQGVKRTLSTTIEDDETQKKRLKISCVEPRPSLTVAENNENQKKPVKPSSEGPQLDTNTDKTFDSLLQQGPVNKLILLRVTEDNKLKLERKYSPLLKPASGENSLEPKLKTGRSNAPVRLSSKSRELNEVTKKEIERRANFLLKSHTKSRDLDPLRTDRSSPLIKSDSRNKEQREYKHTRSSFHSEYNWSKDGSSSRTKSREETRYSSYTSLRSDKGKDQYYSDYHRRREAYYSDHVRGKEAHYSGYSGRREGHHSDHSRTREHYEHGSGSIPRTSSTTHPATARSSNVSGSYYKSLHLDQGEEQTSHSSSRHSSGPYMKRGATLTQEKQNELLNALRDMVHKQLNSSGFKKSSAEEDYSWLDKLNEFNETPQFVPQPTSPSNERK